jgi:hypothetical protein
MWSYRYLVSLIYIQLCITEGKIVYTELITLPEINCSYIPLNSWYTEKYFVASWLDLNFRHFAIIHTKN